MCAVIIGMKLQLTSEQLRAHLTLRMLHHRDRREFYEVKAAEMEAAGERPQNITNDPVKAMKDRADHHAGREQAFGTWAQYLIPDEVYQLDNGDLSRLEMAYL